MKYLRVGFQLSVSMSFITLVLLCSTFIGNGRRMQIEKRKSTQARLREVRIIEEYERMMSSEWARQIIRSYQDSVSDSVVNNLPVRGRNDVDARRRLRDCVRSMRELDSRPRIQTRRMLQEERSQQIFNNYEKIVFEGKVRQLIEDYEKMMRLENARQIIDKYERLMNQQEIENSAAEIVNIAEERLAQQMARNRRGSLSEAEARHILLEAEQSMSEITQEMGWNIEEARTADDSHEIIDDVEHIAHDVEESIVQNRVFAIMNEELMVDKDTKHMPEIVEDTMMQDFVDQAIPLLRNDTHIIHDKPTMRKAALRVANDVEDAMSADKARVVKAAEGTILKNMVPAVYPNASITQSVDYSSQNGVNKDLHVEYRHKDDYANIASDGFVEAVSDQSFARNRG